MRDPWGVSSSGSVIVLTVHQDPVTLVFGMSLAHAEALRDALNDAIVEATAMSFLALASSGGFVGPWVATDGEQT